MFSIPVFFQVLKVKTNSDRLRLMRPGRLVPGYTCDNNIKDGDEGRDRLRRFVPESMRETA